MKILVIGNGGREHTLCWALSRSLRKPELFALPGNGGTAELAENIEGDIADFPGILKHVKDRNIDMVIIGPEAPLVGGLADYLQAEGVRVFGPKRAAAQLEGSKAVAKAFMKKYKIPTAVYEEFTDLDEALKYTAICEYPTVIKADGLAAGKGVSIVFNANEAETELRRIMADRIFGDAGSKVVIEEFLRGEEASILALVDGKTIVPLSPAQDHKAIFDGDKGPNTGGMGTYAPAPVVNDGVMEKIQTTILDRFMKGVVAEKMDYHGVIFIGLMIDKGEPKVLEFNCRFGDPEAQVVLPRLKTDVLSLLEAVIDEKLDQINLEWKDEYAVCVIIASKGYPGAYAKGLPLIDLDQTGAYVFHAGTVRKNGQVFSNGGRVVGLTMMDKSLPKAIEKVYTAVDKVRFEDKYFRHDIAKKALKYL